MIIVNLPPFDTHDANNLSFHVAESKSFAMHKLAAWGRNSNVYWDGFSGTEYSARDLNFHTGGAFQEVGLR